MSHLTSPTGFRTGKTFLWAHSALTTSNNAQATLDQRINLSPALEQVSDRFLRRSNYYTVRSSAKLDSHSGVLKLRVLYYPLIAPLFRTKFFPIHLSHRPFVNMMRYCDAPFKAVLFKLWAMKKVEFNDRFVSTKIKRQLNKWLTASMFRGSKIYRHSRHERLELGSSRLWSRVERGLSNYALQRNYWKRWRHSRRYGFHERLLARHLGQRLGLRVQVQAHNVFNYLIKKSGKLRFKTHQNHLWGKKYHYNKKFFTSYYDVVNAFYLLTQFVSSEHLVMAMIQQGLRKMHRRKIKPKRFFYFLDAVVKNMTEMRDNFHACRVIITGKLRGGTVRTATFSVGFGVMPRQSLSADIRLAFGTVRSKYGAFGIKLITWRKSQHTRDVDALVFKKALDSGASLQSYEGR